jgi:hypothetical protein
MIEFLQNYGLWIALGGVFVVMHRFGMGCCGGGHRHILTKQDKGGADVGTKVEREL